jgi:hypothetical protein
MQGCIHGLLGTALHLYTGNRLGLECGGYSMVPIEVASSLSPVILEKPKRTSRS